MVVVFGSVNLDLVARVARIPSPGETLAGTAFVTAPGGKGANQALAARHAGAAVTFYGAVGRDDFAGAALANLASSSVDLTGVARVDAPTGVALINVDDRGENAITVVAGANAWARADQVTDASLGRGTTLLMQLETSVGEVTQLAARARGAGARVVLNAAPALPLSAALLSNVDVLVVNEHEAAVCAGALGLAPEHARFMADLNRRFGITVVLTLGADGALAWIDGALLPVNAPTVEVVDTTGAGDAFTGALAAALDRGASVADAMAAGVDAGARACTHAGAQRAP